MPVLQDLHIPRMVWVMRLSLLLCALALSAPQAIASPDCSADAMLVFDGSASMSEIGFDTGDATRIVEAREAVRDVMPRVERFRRIGLVTYGPGGVSSCAGVEVKFPPRASAALDVISAIDDLRPEGLTPLTRSVTMAADVLNYETTPAVVVLVTDGNETCGGRPCALAAQLASQGADLTVHVIGFRAVVDFFAWNNPEQDPHTATTVARCLADQTGGRFVTTDTVEELVAALQETLGCLVIGGFTPGSRPAGSYFR